MHVVVVGFICCCCSSAALKPCKDSFWLGCPHDVSDLCEALAVACFVCLRSLAAARQPTPSPPTPPPPPLTA